jgi:hypothetical protein
LNYRLEFLKQLPYDEFDHFTYFGDNEVNLAHFQVRISRLIVIFVFLIALLIFILIIAAAAAFTFFVVLIIFVLVLLLTVFMDDYIGFFLFVES